MNNFDFSNRYQPVLWVKHAGKQVFKNRKLKLPTQLIAVFEDYAERYHVTDTLFPYTPRFIEQFAHAGRPAGQHQQARDRQHPARHVCGAERQARHEARRGAGENRPEQNEL